MKSKFKQLIAYASSFASFVLPKIEVDEIILFGSVARGDATEDSDIDIFFNIKDKAKEKEIKKIIKEQINKFTKTQIYEQFSLKGIKNEIQVEVGNLEKWELKRSIISEGIVLYGKYKTTPEKLKSFTYFNIKPIKNITKRNKIIRKILGRKEKKYRTQGMLKEINGKQLSPSSFVVPVEHANKIIQLFNKEKLDYTLFELWTDQI